MRHRLPLLLCVLCACAAHRPKAEPDASPLIGRAYDARTDALVPRADVEAAVARTDLVLLGEVHDHPEHHRLQADLVRAAAAGGGSPKLALEMIDVGQQAALDAAGPDPEAVAEAVGWAQSGWPDFAIYWPVFMAARETGMPLIGANLPRSTARELVMQGPEVLNPDLRAQVESQWPVPAGALAAAHEEMRASHCGSFPDAMLEPMVRAQLARDTQLAQRLLDAADEGRAVLIAGNGHVRRSGVPKVLARLAPELTVIAVGIVEVAPGVTSAKEALVDADPLDLEASPPFDFVLFTAPQPREDPCEAMKRMRSGDGAGG